jgi:cation diffusion facilitator family transporter
MHLSADDRTWNPFPPTRRLDDRAHRRDAYRALAVSAVGLALTGLIELAIALISGSVGLLGDALHNLSDVSTSLAVFVGFRVSRRPATPARPYGHDRAEDIAGLAVAAVIWASAVFAGAVSVHKLTVKGHTDHLALGMAAAVVGIVGNQLVARYKRRVGHRIHSATLVADAQHSWLDALSSAGALLGLIGVALGFWWADGVAGLVVTLFIAHVGWEVTSGIVVHLMDGIDPQTLAAVERAVLTVPGVEHVHVRGRWIGRSLIIDIEGFVPATLSVHDADRLGREAEHAVATAVPECTAVLWAPRAISVPA